MSITITYFPTGLITNQNRFNVNSTAQVSTIAISLSANRTATSNRVPVIIRTWGVLNQNSHGAILALQSRFL